MNGIDAFVTGLFEAGVCYVSAPSGDVLTNVLSAVSNANDGSIYVEESANSLSALCGSFGASLCGARGISLLDEKSFINLKNVIDSSNTASVIVVLGKAFEKVDFSYEVKNVQELCSYTDKAFYKAEELERPFVIYVDSDLFSEVAEVTTKDFWDYYMGSIPGFERKPINEVSEVISDVSRLFFWPFITGGEFDGDFCIDGNRVCGFDLEGKPGTTVAMMQGISRIEPDLRCAVFTDVRSILSGGISGIANAVYNNGDLLLIVLETKDAPNTDRNYMGERTNSVDIRSVLSGIGVEEVISFNPSSEETKNTIAKSGVRAIIVDCK